MKLSVRHPARPKRRKITAFSPKSTAFTVAIIAAISASAIAMILSSSAHVKQAAVVVSAVIIAGAAGLALLELKRITRPIRALQGFVDAFVSTGEIADIPAELDDELGGLVRTTRNAIVRLNNANRELAIASTLDLTSGLPNRAFAMQRLEHDLARANRSRTAVTIISVDVDGFRRINDQYGTGVGDACLRFFADLAKTCIREGDWIARWGADEFLVVLWEAQSHNAEHVVKRIQHKLATSQDTEEAGILMTASFGYASYTIGERGKELIAKSETALAKAKRFGRNRSVCARP